MFVFYFVFPSFSLSLPPFLPFLLLLFSPLYSLLPPSPLYSSFSLSSRFFPCSFLIFPLLLPSPFLPPPFPSLLSLSLSPFLPPLFFALPNLLIGLDAAINVDHRGTADA